MRRRALTTRSISIVNDGTSRSCASMTTGTRRTMPSRSGLMENRPRPAAACSIGRMLRSNPGNVTRNGRGSGPRMAKPVCSAFSASARGAAELRRRLGRRRCRRLCLIASAKTASLLGSAASFSRVSGIEPAEAAGGDGRRHAIGFGKDDVEADRDGASVAQPGDEIGNHRPRPGPLPDFLQARLVDIGDDDRPHRLLARAQHLKQIERAQTAILRSAAGRRCATAPARTAATHTARATPNCRAQRAMRFMYLIPASRRRPHGSTIAMWPVIIPPAAIGAIAYFSRKARLS